MVEIEVRKDCDTYYGVKVEVEFITSNSAPKGSRMRNIGGVRTNMQRVGDYSYYEAYGDLRSKFTQGSSAVFRNPQYDIEGLKANNYQLNDPLRPRARALIQGVGAALNYTIARGFRDSLNKIDGKQNHLVISAPPGSLQSPWAVSSVLQEEDPVSHLWDKYLVHRGTRMADSYCTTLSMNPSWQVRRVIVTDLCYFFRHKESDPLPLESIEPSIIEDLNKCSHIHIFDDHIVYGGTMENLLRMVVRLLIKLRVSPLPIISCVSWFSVMNRPINKIIKGLIQSEWKHESERKIMPQLRDSGKMCSDISLGMPPPVMGMFPIERLDSDESSFYSTVVLSDQNSKSVRMPIEKRVLNWYVSNQA